MSRALRSTLSHWRFILFLGILSGISGKLVEKVLYDMPPTLPGNSRFIGGTIATLLMCLMMVCIAWANEEDLKP